MHFCCILEHARLNCRHLRVPGCGARTQGGGAAREWDTVR